MRELSALIGEIEACQYECQAGPLKNNIAWRELKDAINGGGRFQPHAPLDTTARIEWRGATPKSSGGT